MRNRIHPLAPLLAVAATVAIVAGCSGGGATSTAAPTTAAVATTSGNTGGLPTGAPVTDLTALCRLLGPGDFAAVGIEGAGAPTSTSDGPGTAYCAYKGVSAAKGGIELDVFVDPDAEGTFTTITEETAAALNELPLPGVDQAVGTDGTAGVEDDFATVIIRKGNLVFTIAAPGGPGVTARLLALAGVVLARGAGLVA
jgi:hypothetical protein